MSAPAKSFCSVCSKAAGVRAGGSAWAVDRFLIPELPLPWPEDPLDARSVPPGVRDTLMSLWNDEVSVGMFAVAPDDAYSVPGTTRILAFDFAAASGAPAQRTDYLVPVELVAETIDALARGHALPDGLETDATPYRDAMICTHGSRDACCATFGFPLYRTLRAAADEVPGLRVWRATHFGGHRFAPTMMTFPDGRSWGYLDTATGLAILERNGPVDLLAGVYRGWSGYTDEALQLLEEAAFQHVGWEWFDYRQRGRRIERADAGDGAVRAEIIGESPDGRCIEVTGEIVPDGVVSAIASCDGPTYETARMVVTQLRLRELAALGDAVRR